MPVAEDRRLPSFWTLQLLGWGGFFVAMSFSRLGRFPLTYMFADKALLAALGIAASLALRTLLRRLMRAQRSLPVLVSASVVGAYLLSTVWTALFNVLLFPIQRAFLGRTFRIGSIGALLDGAVYHSFVLVAWGFLYLGIKQWRAAQEQRERALRAEASAATAQLRALQYQLNPHLFFNTLNAISTLLVERRNDDAALMIARLGDFMRSILRQDVAAQVSLADELALVGRYLDIEQIRFGEGLVVTYDIDEEAYRGLVPLLLLQPLVENAIRHGVAPNSGRGTIAISARRHNGQLDLRIENDAAHATGPSVDSGIGLANTRERLSVLFGERQQLRTLRLPSGGFAVEIGLPFVAQVAS